MFNESQTTRVRGMIMAFLQAGGINLTYDDLTTPAKPDVQDKPFPTREVSNLIADLEGFPANIANSLKAWRVMVQTVSGTFTFRNCCGEDVSRVDGVHTDGMWCSSPANALGLVIRFIDCAFRRIQGVQFLWENGSAKRLYFRGCQTDGKFEFKLMPGCTIEEIVFDGCAGNISIVPLGGTIKKVYANNHQGAVPAGAISGLPPDLQSAPTTNTPTEPTVLKSDYDKVVASLKTANESLVAAEQKSADLSSKIGILRESINIRAGAISAEVQVLKDAAAAQ